MENKERPLGRNYKLSLKEKNLSTIGTKSLGDLTLAIWNTLLFGIKSIKSFQFIKVTVEKWDGKCKFYILTG